MQGQVENRRRGDGAATAKIEKSFRETPKPLKSLKTAKSSLFRRERNQRLSKAPDFAGETISFRFGFVSVRREIPHPKMRQWRRLKNLQKGR